jgi:hypothetical protein
MKEMNMEENARTSTAEEIATVRRLVDAGIRNVTNTTLEELEAISGPLSKEEILVFAAIGARLEGLGG